MDCERLDALAIDLVYAEEGGEIGVRDREAAEAHLEGCARCAAMIERLRGGLLAAAELPLADPSSLLEARILAAASAVKPARSWPRRITRAISTAGGWAMRPQIAMAAVLVIMVGTSVLLLRGSAINARRTKVTDEGQPVATLEPPALSEGQGAPGVIGGEKKPAAPAPPPARNEQAPTDMPAADELAKEAKDKNKAEPKSTDDGDGKDLQLGGKLAAKGEAAAGPAPAQTAAPMPMGGAGAVATPQAAPPAEPADPTKADKDATGKKTAAAEAVATPGTFDESMTAYKEARWAAAAKGFEAQANAGTKPATSWLYAARSFRASGSCVQAIPRFQKVLAGYPTTSEAPYAALEGGQCARSVGDTATARTLLEKAKGYPATQKQAEAELAAMNAPPAPAKAKAAKPNAMDNGY